ncbi:hypothetical protein MaudMau93_004603 [Microsporum audouinii]
MASLKEYALKAASKARSHVLTHSHNIYPWLFVRNCEEIEEVFIKWLRDRANLDRVSEQTGTRFAEDPFNNLVQKFAIVWTQKTAKLERPFPGKYLVILALDRLDSDNGLPILQDKSGLPVGSLDPGGFVVISGDDTIILGDGSGGITLFIILNFS